MKNLLHMMIISAIMNEESSGCDNVNKKVTMKEIAEKAGVSAATVSYVLNNREDQRISEETRRKILQISNILGYTGKFAAFTPENSTNNIGLYLPERSFALAEAEQMLFVRMLTETLKLNNYRLTLLPATYTGPLEQLDAVICFSTSKEFFYSVGSNLYIPQIAVDTIISDEWIFSVINNFSQLVPNGLDRYRVLSLDFDSVELKAEVEKTFHEVEFVRSFEEIDWFIQQSAEEQILALGDSLYQYVKSKCIHVRRCPLHTQNKMNKIIECLKLGMAHTDVENHRVLV